MRNELKELIITGLRQYAYYLKAKDQCSSAKSDIRVGIEEVMSEKWGKNSPTLKLWISIDRERKDVIVETYLVKKAENIETTWEQLYQRVAANMFFDSFATNHQQQLKIKAL